jgi:hypothetical protein
MEHAVAPCIDRPMNVQLIIDAIVRQTTILIAQVATTSGQRSPLAKVANQVFLDLRVCEWRLWSTNRVST